MIKQPEGRDPTTIFHPARSIMAVVYAVIYAYILLIVCFALLAAVYTYTPMKEDSLTTWVSLANALSLFFAGFGASRRANTLGYLHGALAGLVHSLMRIGAGFLVFNNVISDNSPGATIAFSVIVAAFGGVVGVNVKGHKRKRK